MKKWEYKVVGINGALDAADAEKLQNKLNTVGENGWELVSVLDQVNSGFGVQPRVYCNMILFKREKENS